MFGPLTVRSSSADDIAAISEIYAHEVLHGLATFEEVPPAVDEMATRRAAVLDLGLPFLVAELKGAVIGYAYAGNFRPRPAYRYAIENSVYIDRNTRGQGVGSALLAQLIEDCEKGPWRQMVAVIGGTNNHGSIALHRSHGFEHVGTIRSVGFKLGQWVDTVTMQRPLGSGDTTLPVK